MCHRLAGLGRVDRRRRGLEHLDELAGDLALLRRQGHLPARVRAQHLERRQAGRVLDLRLLRLDPLRAHRLDLAAVGGGPEGAQDRVGDLVGEHPTLGVGGGGGPLDEQAVAILEDDDPLHGRLEAAEVGVRVGCDGLKRGGREHRGRGGGAGGDDAHEREPCGDGGKHGDLQV